MKNFYFCMTNTLRRTQNLNLWFQPENSRFEVRDRSSRTSWHAQWLSCCKNTSGWRRWYQESLVLKFPNMYRCFLHKAVFLAQVLSGNRPCMLSKVAIKNTNLMLLSQRFAFQRYSVGPLSLLNLLDLQQDIQNQIRLFFVYFVTK